MTSQGRDKLLYTAIAVWIIFCTVILIGTANAHGPEAPRPKVCLTSEERLHQLDTVLHARMPMMDKLDLLHHLLKKHYICRELQRKT